jgi:hypothetical protein
MVAALSGHNISSTSNTKRVSHIAIQPLESAIFSEPEEQLADPLRTRETHHPMHLNRIFNLTQLVGQDVHFMPAGNECCRQGADNPADACLAIAAESFQSNAHADSPAVLGFKKLPSLYRRASA